MLFEGGERSTLILQSIVNPFAVSGSIVTNQTMFRCRSHFQATMCGDASYEHRHVIRPLCVFNNTYPISRTPDCRQLGVARFECADFLHRDCAIFTRYQNCLKNLMIYNRMEGSKVKIKNQFRVLLQAIARFVHRLHYKILMANPSFHGLKGLKPGSIKICVRRSQPHQSCADLPSTTP